jgi:hypothetical protein
MNPWRKTIVNMSIQRDERLALEEAHVKRAFPHFRLYVCRGICFFSGWIIMYSNRYKLRLVLPPGYPYLRPRLFIVWPKILWDAKHRRTINSFRMSHRFYTEDNGPSGCVQISYAATWDANSTCLKALGGGIRWLSMYQEHLRTGKDFLELERSTAR